MTLMDRLTSWVQKGLLSPEQGQVLRALESRQRFSVYLELNALLYVGVLAFVGSLGWTLREYLTRLTDLIVVLGLGSAVVLSLGHCFLRGKPFSRDEVESPHLYFDYVLYFGALAWSVLLGYLQQRYQIAGHRWDHLLMASSVFYFLLAYRFDNRFVLSLALTTLAAWFGIRSQSTLHLFANDYKWRAVGFGITTGLLGSSLWALRLKRHFLDTFLHFAVNAILVTAMGQIVLREQATLWALLLFGTAVASWTYGVKDRSFSFVAYAAVYAYIGLSARLLREIHDTTLILSYFVVSGGLMIALLVGMARRFGRDA